MGLTFAFINPVTSDNRSSGHSCSYQRCIYISAEVLCWFYTKMTRVCRWTVTVWEYLYSVSQASDHRAPAGFQSSHLISDWITAGTETQQSTNHRSGVSDRRVFISVLSCFSAGQKQLLGFAFFQLRILTNKKLGHFYPLAIRRELSVLLSLPLQTLFSPGSVRSFPHWTRLNWMLLFVLMFRLK